MDVSTQTMNPQNPNTAGGNKQLLKRAMPLVLVAALLFIGWFNNLHELFSLSSLIQNRTYLGQIVSDNYVFAIFAYVALYILLVGISFPGASFVTIAGGLFFGGFAGGLLTVIGATLGAVVIFLIARSSFGDVLEKKAGPFISKMLDGFKEDQFLYLLSLRFTPIFPFWVVNIVPALLNVKVLPYAAATFLGIIPGTFAYAYIGSGLDSIIDAQQQANPGCAADGSCKIDLSALVTGELLFAMAALGVVSLAPVIIKKLRPKKTADK